MRRMTKTDFWQQFMRHLCKNKAPINAKKGDIEISGKNKKDTWVYLRLLLDYRKVYTKILNQGILNSRF